MCFYFSKSSGRNNAKYAFQYTFKNNTTRYAKKKKKKKKEQSSEILNEIRGGLPIQFLTPPKARFKRRATAVPNSIDQIKFDFSTATARRLKASRASAVPNSIHKLS